MSPFSHHGLPVGGKEWMQQGGHRERNATRGMGLENERYCDGSVIGPARRMRRACVCMGVCECMGDVLPGVRGWTACT